VTLSEAVPGGYAFEDELAALAQEPAGAATGADEEAARRDHPSMWGSSAEASQSGPRARPHEQDEAPRAPDELPVRRPRARAPPPPAEPVPAEEPVASVEPLPSRLPEPLVESGTSSTGPVASGGTPRPASVDRPPTDGLFSTRNGQRDEANGGSPHAPRLFGGADRPPLPMPGGASRPDRPGATAGSESGTDALGQRTASGLVRRTPRADGDSERPRPGGESTARGVATTQRSPDEVRAMLSRFRTGQQQAAGARDEQSRADDRTTDVDADAGRSNEDQ
jgi:hypothetical protein